MNEVKRDKKGKLVLNNVAVATLNKNNFQRIRFNLQAPVRQDQMEGRNYTVVPMVMLTEGVHEGSAGPLYYPADELSKTPQVWNHKPIIVYHPAQGFTACDPDILTNRKIGVVMNAKWEDDKLKAEAWLEEDRMKKVDNRVAVAVENQEMMELSTGLFTDNDMISGEWNGEGFVSTAFNYRPDHLAVLPDQIGACSIEDGAGLLRLNQAIKKEPRLLQQIRKMMKQNEVWNELSHSNIWSALNSQIREKHGDDSWIEDVYDSFFIFQNGPKLFKQSYSETDNQVMLGDAIEEVVQVTEYRSLDGAFIGNDTRKENTVNKKKAVDNLIKNSKWVETDREFLMGLEEDQLEKMVGNEEETPAVETEEKTDVQVVAEEGAKDVEKPAPEVDTPAENKQPTLDEYIDEAPAEMQDVLRTGVQTHNAQKDALAKAIIANEANVFTEEVLKSKTLDELKAIAALAVDPAKEKAIRENVYVGMGAAPEGTPTEEPLIAPTLNFGPDKE